MERSLLLTILAMPCWANAITIDQSFTGLVNEAYNINECCKFVAQTYTAGLTGTLAGIDVDISSYVSNLYPLNIEIQSVVGGVPTGTILGNTTLSSSSSLLSSLITFSQTVPQVAGAQYAIVADYPTAPFVPGNAGQGVAVWAGATGDLYAGGQALAFLDGSWTNIDCGCDSFFQTFVNTTPEPSSLILVLTLAVIAVVLRRKICRHTYS